MMVLEDFRKLNKKAVELYKNGKIFFRSCWNCNLAHEYLKDTNDTAIMSCFICNHWFLDGEDLTTLHDHYQIDE